MPDSDTEVDWKDRVGHGEAPWTDAECIVELVVTSGRDENVSRWALGKGLIGSTDADPQVRVAIDRRDLEEVATGRTAPAVAYMQGRLKPSGDMGLALVLLEHSSTPQFASWIAALRP